MAKKPTTPDVPMHLVTMNNLSWGSKLLIPSSLLTQFSQLMSMIEVVEEEYLQGGAYTMYPMGDVDYGIATVTDKYVICTDKKEAKEFKAYHDATAEMTKDEDKIANRAVVSLEEFRTSHSRPKEDQQ